MKELEQFIENFAKQFNDINPSEINAKTKFKELEEWGSIGALLTIVMVDDVYQKNINGDDIRNAETIEDLFLVINSR